jgi:hypothetical protein
MRKLFCLVLLGLLLGKANGQVKPSSKGESAAIAAKCKAKLIYQPKLQWPEDWLGKDEKYVHEPVKSIHHSRGRHSTRRQVDSSHGRERARCLHREICPSMEIPADASLPRRGNYDVHHNRFQLVMRSGKRSRAGDVDDGVGHGNA